MSVTLFLVRTGGMWSSGTVFPSEYGSVPYSYDSGASKLKEKLV